MINARTIGVLVLSIVFLLCIPVHILSETLVLEHATAHHMSGHAESDVFSHFDDMANVHWITFTIIISSALVLWFALQDAFFALALHSLPRYFYRKKYHLRTSELFRWLLLHHTSPPRIA